MSACTWGSRRKLGILRSLKKCLRFRSSCGARTLTCGKKAPWWRAEFGKYAGQRFCHRRIEPRPCRVLRSDRKRGESRGRQPLARVEAWLRSVWKLARNAAVFLNQRPIPGSAQELCHALGVKALIGVPLKRRGKVVGVLEVHFAQLNSFHDQEMRPATAIGPSRKMPLSRDRTMLGRP